MLRCHATLFERQPLLPREILPDCPCARSIVIASQSLNPQKKTTMHALNKDDLQEFQQQKPPGFVSEFVDFMMRNRKVWLLPLMVMLLVLLVLLLQAPAPSEPGI